MQNPISKVGMVATPDNWDRIHDMIKASGDPSTATVIAMMVWNLASKTVDEALEANAE